MRAFAEERLEVTAENTAEIDGCLVCRACETVCPSGVQFGEMMELTRNLIEETPARSPAARTAKRWFFRHVLPKPARLRLAVALLAFYQRSGLRTAARTFGLNHLLPSMRSATVRKYLFWRSNRVWPKKPAVTIRERSSRAA